MCVVRFGFLVDSGQSGESLTTINGKESCFLPAKSSHFIEKLLKHTVELQLDKTMIFKALRGREGTGNFQLRV